MPEFAEDAETFVPDNPVLRGLTQVPDQVPSRPDLKLDELPHRERARYQLVNDEPDPGYDPDGDDLDEAIT